jgi:hypothetical protein
MKALTALCTAERPISNGLHNNCENSLQSVYIHAVSLCLLETSVFDVTCIKHVSVKVLHTAFFTAIKTIH